MVAASKATKVAGAVDTANSSGIALTASGKPKEKRRNNEKRKEKSRDAARCRRSRETEIFSDLGQVLPLTKEDVNQLDKASIMRIAIAYLKVRDMLQLFPKIQKLANDSVEAETSISDDGLKKSDSYDLLNCAEASQLIKQTLDGFLLILSNDGDITYVSENITEYLGLAKIDILGQQVWEYLHQCDHAELKEALNIKRNGMADKVKEENLLEEGLSTDHRDIFVRFKCTITSRGRSINIKSASYKVIHLTGHLAVNKKGERVLVTVGRPIPHPSNVETPLGTTTFLTKHSLDMKFTYVDEKMLELLGYDSEDLLNKSLFEYHHASDAESLMSTFKIVLSKGQGETQRYRFLAKHGGYCWVLTQATMIYDKMKPQNMVCVNYLISHIENGHEIYSLAQYEASQARIKTEDTNNNKENNNITNNQIKQIEIDEVNDKPIIITKTTTTTNQNKTLVNDNSNNNNDNNINQTVIKPLTTSINIDNNSILTKTTTANTTNTINHIKRLTTLNTPPTTTVTSKLLKTNKTTATIKSLSSSPHPKSVTASVFRSVTGILPNILNKTNNNKNNNNNNNNSTDNKTTITTPTIINDNKKINGFKNSLQLPTNVATSSRAQSVTASVFTPISHINSKAQQQSNNNHIILKATTSTAAILAVQQQRPLQKQQQEQQQQQEKQPQDMNKGFLTFAEDASNELTMLKEEPDDLAHLATSTNVVDACMPLDETVPLFGEVLVGLMGSYGSLLPDDINSLDSTASSTNDSTQIAADTVKISTRKQNCNNSNNNYNSNNNKRNNNNVSETTFTTTSSLNGNKSKGSGATNVAHIDPFINYREESNDTNCSQHLLSPSVTSTSPEASSLPSLCSPNSLSQEDEFAFMTMNVDDDIDLTMRAPYIPMNEQDDLPLLTADDLMWCSSNAFSTDDIQMQKDIADVMQQQFQQLQQIQASCENPHLRNNILDFNNSNTTTTVQQTQQQQQQNQQQLNTNFSNSLCSSPASTVSSLSPSPVNNNNLQQQHVNAQQDTNSTNTVFSTDSSELAALLCGSGSGTLTILGGNNCNDETEGNCNGIVGGGSVDAENIVGGINRNNNNNNNNNNNCTTNNIGGVVGIANHHFRHQLIDDDLQQHQLQRQQQQQLLGNLNIICKKEKFDTNALTSSLCDSIEDAFETAYSKDSTNLDCWNEFLPINVTETRIATAIGQPQPSENLELDYQNENCKQQQQIQQQGLLLNAVPLITIQNNKNILLQEQETQERIIINNNDGNINKLIVNDEMLSAATSNNRNNNKLATIKLLNGTTTATTMRLIDAKQQQHQQQHLLQQQQQRNQTVTKTTIIQQQQHGNKRHLNGNPMQFEIKRLKSDSTELQATPQLLQQLIAPVQQQQQQPQQPLTIKIEQQQMNKTQKSQQQQQQRNKLNIQRWSAADSQQQASPPPQQQSDSVLKNLLISGCDDLKTPEPMFTDENSLDNGAPTSPFSTSSISPNTPLGCLTSTASVLRNYRHNPMIGGPGILPSPTFIHNDDSCSSPPELITADISDTSSDSGIDDTNTMDEANNLNTDFVVDVNAEEINAKQQPFSSGLLLIKTTDVEKSNASKLNNLNAGEIDERELKRKTSISFMDSSNPLLTTPYLMDLCNDDYNMNAGEFFEQNDIESVLNQWS